MVCRKPIHDDQKAECVPGTLFNASARTTDPDTSHEAADAANDAGLPMKHGRKILACIRALGPGTSKELGVSTGLGQHAVARRMRELERAGLVEDSGERRERSIVWRIA